jgi:hypothetical protein
MGESSALYIIPAILVSSLLVFVVLCIMRVRRLRAADLDRDDSIPPPAGSLHQLRASRRTARGGRWPHRGRGDSDIESAPAAIRLTPIRTNLGGRHSILQPTYIATARGLRSDNLADASASQARSSPVSATLPPLPHTPPPPYNEAMRRTESAATRQTWL